MSTPPATPRIVLGMTLYNNAKHLPEATASLLAQSRSDFVLLMLDDASTDATPAIAQAYVREDARVRYIRHEQRQGMVPTWRQVAELAVREYPAAEYFAWTSDHDRWHPEWLARLTEALERNEDVVLAYPQCAWIDESGSPVAKRPRRFETRGMQQVRERWSHLCRDIVGAGDMVYGLMRLDALRRAGVFRTVLRPDRLLMAELTLQGQIHQSEEVLWTRRQGAEGSVARQRRTLVAGPSPWWFWLPPWVQHASVLWREYSADDARPPISRLSLIAMVTLYQLTYTLRHIRRSVVGRGIDASLEAASAIAKTVKHFYRELPVWARLARRNAFGRLRWYVRHGRHELALAMSTLTARSRRVWRHRVHDALVLSRRLGLRGGSSEGK